MEKDEETNKQKKQMIAEQIVIMGEIWLLGTLSEFSG